MKCVCQIQTCSAYHCLLKYFSYLCTIHTCLYYILLIITLTVPTAEENKL